MRHLAVKPTIVVTKQAAPFGYACDINGQRLRPATLMEYMESAQQAEHDGKGMVPDEYGGQPIFVTME